MFPSFRGARLMTVIKQDDLIQSVADFDLSFEEAARDLGATPLKAFWLVTLPIIGPTIAGAAILAVALSMDEFLITVFVTGSDTTLPLMILSMMRRAVSPTINAASVFMLVVTIAIIV